MSKVVGYYTSYSFVVISVRGLDDDDLSIREFATEEDAEENYDSYRNCW